MNIADENQIKNQERKVKSARDREMDDLRFILNDPRGRRFYWRYLAKCGVFRSSFTGNSTTFFNEGQRQVGLDLLADLNEGAPEAYLVMLKENTNRKDFEDV